VSATRRNVLAAGLGLLATARLHAAAGSTKARVVVVGGGFGGATCARYLKRFAPALAVTLVEPAETFVTCPMSNAVLGGLMELEQITYGYAALVRDGIEHVRRAATGIDPETRRVTLEGGEKLAYDRLVLSPGVDLVFAAVDGTTTRTTELMPHAWKAGEQTRLLRAQLQSMRAGGVFVIGIPDNPYRCPPGPYERACLVAEYFRRHNPAAKILLLDAKDTFTKQPLFEEAWRTLYPRMIERIPRAEGGTVIAVDDTKRTFVTEFDEFQADVANFIPPQRAAGIARTAGLDAGRGWCEVDPATFESREAPGIHVLGDAVNANPMPKSGFAANNQAKVCAAAVVALLAGEAPPEPFLVNTCYSLAAADWGISVTGVYRVSDDKLVAVEGSTGETAANAPRATRELEARHTYEWYRAIVHDTFG